MTQLETTLEGSYAALGEAFGSQVAPTPLRGARLFHVNRPLQRALGLELSDETLLAVCNGRHDLPGASWTAQVYAGHQFGYFVPRLGDGRAVLVGELRDPDGRPWDLHLKGGGPTPYSRGGDGRAVLRSSVREYLAGEALHGLGVATTRALCLIASEQHVRREVVETGASILRVAPSHVRFGSFEYFARRGETERVRQLAEHVIARHFPALCDDPQRFLLLLREAVERTARLVADWQTFGFAHGVLNSDNMSILGLTLDLGPYGFLEAFAPGWVCNHSDHHGRYAFDRQPDVGLWNLLRLAEALASLVPAAEAEVELNRYGPAFVARYRERMQARLGLLEWRDEEDDELLANLLELMQRHGADLTRTFRQLSNWQPCADPAPLRAEIPDPGLLDAWLARYARRLEGDGASLERRLRMRRANPKYVLRNYLAQEAIEAAEHGDDTKLLELLEVLADPFAEQPEREHLAGPTPEWGKRIVVSCSS